MMSLKLKRYLLSQWKYGSDKGSAVVQTRCNSGCRVALQLPPRSLGPKHSSGSTGMFLSTLLGVDGITSVTSENCKFLQKCSLVYESRPSSRHHKHVIFYYDEICLLWTVRSDKDLSLLRAAFPEVLQVRTLGSHEELCYGIHALTIFGYKISIIILPEVRSSVHQWVT